ncbi:MAG: hypothetical protein Q8L36_00215 [bacterium]|nr:hypothetical protein [bacterium]
MTKQEKRDLFQDLAIIFFSVIFALILIKTDILISVLESSQKLEWLGSLIAGMFFTSILTTAPAIVTLGQMAQTNSLWLTALFGALGAVIGDLVIFRFVRDRFEEHLQELISHKTGGRRFKALFKLKIMRWLTFLVGGLIIASPLPDELGIGLLGFSKTKTSMFIPLSFICNFAGILAIGLTARALL